MKKQRKKISCTRSIFNLPLTVEHIEHLLISSSVREVQLTSVLRLDGDDALPLWTEALRGPSLDFKFVGNILAQVWDGQAGLRTVAVHLE